MDSPDAARAQDVTSRRWSRWERSFRRACRDGRGHRGRGAHDRARRHERDGRRESRGPLTTRERLIHRRTKSWQPSSLSTMSSVFLNNSLSPLQLPSFSLSLSSLSLSLSYPSPANRSVRGITLSTQNCAQAGNGTGGTNKGPAYYGEGSPVFYSITLTKCT